MSNSGADGDVPAALVPLSQAVLSGDQALAISGPFKALADPVRLRLLSLVWSAPAGELRVHELTGQFDLTQPTISHHLKVLHAAGLLERERRGTSTFYRARIAALGSIGELFQVEHRQIAPTSIAPARAPSTPPAANDFPH